LTFLQQGGFASAKFRVQRDVPHNDFYTDILENVGLTILLLKGFHRKETL